MHTGRLELCLLKRSTALIYGLNMESLSAEQKHCFNLMSWTVVEMETANNALNTVLASLSLRNL